MKYYIEIDADNDAFYQNGPATEIRRLLGEIAFRVESFSFEHEENEFPIKDINGNKVGVHGYKEGPFED